MARVIVLGASGMIGHMVATVLAERGHTVSGVARESRKGIERLDLENELELQPFLERERPDLVVNCAGVLIQASEADPVHALKLNALLPRLLSRLALKLGYRLIHLSSDCVFSGACGPYRESDARDADGIYGRTKALGEVMAGNDLTIRTSKIGPELKEGTGLFDWFMRQREPITGFANALWGGVTTLETAKAIDWIIDHPLAGLVHLTNNEPISKYDLLQSIKRIWNRPLPEIRRDESHCSNRSLLCERKDFSYSVPSYESMLRELYEYMQNHRSLYGRYEKA